MAVPWLLSAVRGKQTPETLHRHQATQRSRAAWHRRRREMARKEGRQEARGGGGGPQVRQEEGDGGGGPRVRQEARGGGYGPQVRQEARVVRWTQVGLEACAIGLDLESERRLRWWGLTLSKTGGSGGGGGH